MVDVESWGWHNTTSCKDSYDIDAKIVGQTRNLPPCIEMHEPTMTSVLEHRCHLLVGIC